MKDVSRPVATSSTVVNEFGSSPIDAWGTCALVVLLVAAVAIASTTGVGFGVSWFDEQRIVLLAELAVTALIARVLRPASTDKATALLAAAFGPV